MKLKYDYIIYRYNYLHSNWEQFFTSSDRKLCNVKLMQLRLQHPYTNFIMRQEVAIVG